MNKIITIDNEKAIICSGGKIFEKLLEIISESDLSGKVLNEKIKFSDFFQDAQQLIDIYNLYEFSDRIIVIFDSTRFGGIINLVDTGLLTLEEAVKAVLR